MSNLIPPLLSSTPPPITGPLDEEDDDEFGDFRAAESYDCDDFSLPPSPQKSPEKSDFSKVNLDINSNNSQITSTTEMPTKTISETVEKDFQDRRKSLEEASDFKYCEIEVNCSSSQSTVFNIPNEGQDQTPDEKPEPDVGANKNDQICETDAFSDLQNGVPSSITNCDEIKPKDDASNVEIEVVQILNGSQNGEFSEKSNSDELSDSNETNEIKSDADSDKENNGGTADCENSESSMSLKVCETDPKLSCETDTKLSDDEFGDFENHFATEIETEPPKEDLDDEFDDFVSPLPPPISEQKLADDDFGNFESSDLAQDEFGDFGDFSTHTDSGCEKPVMEIDEKNAFSKSEAILKEIFPVVETEADNYEYFDETKGNSVFDELKDVTETNALVYQWSKSNGQKMFLKSLNIDLRNILYGPAWNCSMPRFAANLGLTPLEPVKSEILTPTPVRNASSPSNSSQKNTSDIPTAQFDWSGSGLINPLDYSQTMLLDLEQLVASLDIPSTTNPTSNQSPSPSNELFDEWDIWLQSTSTELPGNVPEDSSQPPIKPDFLPITSDKPESVTLFETTIPPPTKEQTSTTEIANFDLPKPTNDQTDDFPPFQSPKMMIPLRETHISNETINEIGSKPGWLEPTILTPDLPRKEPIVDPDDDDEFDDFQMVLPEEIKEKPVEATVKNIPFDLSDFDTVAAPVNKPAQSQEHIFKIPPSEPTLFNSGPINSVQKQANSVDDDEFTDFHSSLPPSKPPEILAPLQSFPIEPLKPSVQYTPIASTQINWPDPGVTDEDIRNIELTYSRKTEPLPNSKTEPEFKEKESSVDDDEWSDFVSVTNPVKPTMPERTATPDLPLSVLNLNHVQAPKQPIPVITPTGLVQTKLSSNLSLQPKSVVQTTLQPSMYRPPPTMMHPSTISSQFAATQSQDDDDDWSDFVSSQPPPVANGYQQKGSFVQKAPMNWNNANIITNPTHFDSFQGYVPQQKKTAAARSAIPSISAIPDLDFIAPKNRTKK